MDPRRPLTPKEELQWGELMGKLNGVQLNGGRDKMIWKLEKSGSYSTKSMFRCLLYQGVSDKRMKKLWKSKLPMKLKTFMWLVFQDTIQSGVTLRRMKWKGNPNCVVCGKPESANHIFFYCVLARFTWECLREAMGWDRPPRSLQDFLENWLLLHDGGYGLKLYELTMTLWSLWMTCNKMAIEGVFPKDPADILFKIHTCLQRWRARLECTEAAKLDEMMAQARGWTEAFLERRKDCLPVESFI
jgi:hypothetical protein